MRVAAAIGIVFLALAALAAADQPLGDLSTSIDLNSGDIRGVEAGQTITRIRPSQDPDEVSVLGAIRIDVSPTDVANRLADIVQFKKGPAVLEIGIFGTPARPTDLAALTLSGCGHATGSIESAGPHQVKGAFPGHDRRTRSPGIIAFAETLRDQLCKAGYCPTYLVFKDPLQDRARHTVIHGIG